MRSRLSNEGATEGAAKDATEGADEDATLDAAEVV